MTARGDMCPARSCCGASGGSRQVPVEDLAHRSQQVIGSEWLLQEGHLGRQHLDVYSEPDHGTTFKIYLPRVEAAADARPTAPSSEVAHFRGDETILLVEDEEMIRRVVRDALR